MDFNPSFTLIMCFTVIWNICPEAISIGRQGPNSLSSYTCYLFPQQVLNAIFSIICKVILTWAIAYSIKVKKTVMEQAVIQTSMAYILSF